MDIITTHTNSDLDALAAMVAAQKLYPNADLVFPGKLSRNVEEFLALHKDMLKIKPVKLVDMDKVRRLIIVDNHNPKRIGKLAKLMENPKVEVHIYDHHPATECFLNHKITVIDTVGAATTILVEKIKQQNIDFTPLEATIMALGIYDDTGCMVFNSTTPRDVEAVAYLLANGANLSVISEFLGRPLTEEQQELLKRLLVTAERHNINGVKILIAKGKSEEFIDGLAVLTHRLAEIEQVDAVFAAVEMEDRVHIVSRCSVPEVNCREILANFGGGGHIAAASASVKEADLDTLTTQLLTIISESVRPMMTVRDIMSNPVKTVYPETTIEEANRVMLRYGHTGLPVVRGLEMVGVVSRRDVEKAMHHGLGHAPVKAYMNVNVHTINADVPLSQAQEMMIEFDIGRLPVVEDNRVVGIISRSDILRTLHDDFKGRYYTTYHQTSGAKVKMKNMMRRVLPEEVMDTLKLVGKLAQQLDYKVYAGGGIVRDIILNVENFDVDLIVEGDAITLAKELGRELGGKVRTYEKFGTAEVSMSDGSWIDVATARVEFYEYPAAMPTVETSSLKHDLYRRDITINAMAVSLNPENFGELVDYFGGREDLYAGIVRVLHNLSFVEDPTRILRAVRFEQRYQMHMDPQTLHLLQEAIREEVLLKVSHERIWYELKVILNEPEPVDVLSRLAELGVWDQLFPEVTFWEVQPVLEELPQALLVLRNWGWNEPAEKWLPYLIAMLHWNDVDNATKVCERFVIGRRQTEKIISAVKHWPKVLDTLADPKTTKLSQHAGVLLQLLPREAYPMFLAIMEDRLAIQRFRQVMEAVRQNKPTVNGKDLKSMGFKPGPLYRKALDAVWQARMDGVVRTREDELEFVEQYIHSLQKGEKSCVR